MHVGLNLVYLVPGETGGTETYARELIPALLRERPNIKLTAFVNREAAGQDGPWSDLVAAVTVPVRARNRWQWVRGEQQLLPRLAKRAGVDIVHSLASTAPVRGTFRRVVTIQDVIHRVYPEAHHGLRSLGMRVLVPMAARRSDRIIVPSRATHDDLVRLLGVPERKIDVVPLGFKTPHVSSWLADDELRRRHDLGMRPVVLTVSAKRQHKNLVRLLDALASIPEPRRPIVVLPGYATPHEEELREHASRLGLAADTRFLGWVSEDELEGLYRSATCFVFPSLYEGFGLPVLEAMARGVPVACSKRSALAEVANGAALTFDPEQPKEIADAIELLLEDGATRDRLRAAGHANVARFSWDETARRTLAVYDRTLASGRG
jgi:glycosyltransferase involved in cell wall biosynthesis